jgi:hypothetical protein
VCCSASRTAALARARVAFIRAACRAAARSRSAGDSAC